MSCPEVPMPAIFILYIKMLLCIISLSSRGHQSIVFSLSLDYANFSRSSYKVSVCDMEYKLSKASCSFRECCMIVVSEVTIEEQNMESPWASPPEFWRTSHLTFVTETFQHCQVGTPPGKVILQKPQKGGQGNR